MKTKNFRFIIAFITFTIVATIGLQVFWNIKNYSENKHQLVNEVLNAFDNGIEYYYVEDVKNDFVAFIADSTVKSDAFIDNIKLDTLFKTKDTQIKKAPTSEKIATKIEWKTLSTDGDQSNSIDLKKDSLQIIINQATKIINQPRESSSKKVKLNTLNSSDISSISVLKGKKNSDSISKINDIANRIVISMIRDSIDFKKLSRNLNLELKRKNIVVDYAIYHFKSNKLFDQFTTNKKEKLPLIAESKSIYLPQHQQLKIAFSDPVFLILKRSLIEIMLSFLLSLSIIGCLVYLLKVIQQQKKVDEIKNDLISNITHEFKTPITTIATAIEGIKSFNSENDVEKTNRYLDISGNQLKKLELMVERLLETASLDTNQLMVKKQKTDIIPIVNSCIEKHKLNNPEKTILLQTDVAELFVNIDSFHIENVISNIIDNALKYGGNTIKIKLISNQKTTSILIEDNGNGIDKSSKEKIFEKFYRIPKGNIHDIKGFGIGLFYSKKIIEKHGGTLELVSNSNPTSFKITLFDEN
jgi:signal transduction histidine kinase